MQTQYNVKPGDHAKIINSANGEKGASVGRVVLVMFDRPHHGEMDAAYCDQMNALNDPKHYCPPSPYEKEHSKLGKIWPCKSIDGKPFVSESGGIGEYIDVPDRWLVKCDPPPAILKEKKAELTE